MDTKAAADAVEKWIPQFFNTTWARFVDRTFLLLVSLWAWFAVIPTIDSDRLAPRPLSWYRTQVESMGWHFPKVLDDLADWQPPPGAWQPQVAVLAAAVMCTLAATKAAVPGFRLSATALLVMAMQWFGVRSVLTSYVLVMVGVIGVVVIKCWIDDRRIPADDAAYAYQPTIVARYVVNGPGAVLLLPVLSPLAAIPYALHAFAFDNSNLHDPPELTMLTEAIERSSPESGSLTSMSARQFAMVLATAQLAARTDESTRAKIARRLHWRYQQRVVGDR